jgi:hypothetical protein
MRYRWLQMLFRVGPSEDAASFVALPAEDVTDNLAEILDRLQEAERKHSRLSFGLIDLSH